MRKQYHFRSGASGLRAWDVDRLVALTRHLEPRLVPLAEIRELDEYYWDKRMTPRDVAEHARLIEEADLSYPIILSSDGRIMDGMHRAAKAALLGKTHLLAVRFEIDPEPDHVGVHPDDLPYDEPSEAWRAMDLDTQVKLAVYRHFAETGGAPGPADVAARIGADPEQVLGAYPRLRAQRLLVLEADGASIRMAAPFSGVPTQHVVEAGGIRYFANCAWDALGVPAALRKPGIVQSRCGQSGEPLRLAVGLNGPERSDWLFHCLVPAARWWDDIVFT